MGHVHRQLGVKNEVEYRRYLPRWVLMHDTEPGLRLSLSAEWIRARLSVMEFALQSTTPSTPVRSFHPAIFISRSASVAGIGMFAFATNSTYAPLELPF